MANKQTKHNLTLGANNVKYAFLNKGIIYLEIITDNNSDDVQHISVEDIEGKLLCTDSSSPSKFKLTCSLHVESNKNYIIKNNLDNFNVVSFTFTEGESDVHC